MPGISKKGIGKDRRNSILRADLLKLRKRIRDLEETRKALLRQEKNFQDIYDTVREGIVYTSLSGKVISVNRSLENILGLTVEGIIGKNILTLTRKLLQPAEAAAVLPLMKSVISGKELKPFEIRYRDKILEISVIINIKTRRITGTIRDITENKKIADALAKSEARLNRAELSSKSGNWELHLDTGLMIGSEGAGKIYGIEKESVSYPEVRKIPLPEYRAMMDEAMNDLINNNKPYNIEFKIKKVNTGEIIDIHSIAEYDRQKRILYGSIQDITDRKKAEEQIIKKNQDLAKLFNISLHLLESVERRKVLQQIASSSAQFVGSDSSAIYIVKDQELFLEVTSPELPENFPEAYRKAMLNHHPHIKRAIDTSTTVVISDVSAEPLTAEERDIAERRNLCSIIYIPLFIHNRAAGVLILGTVGRTHNFDRHEMDMFRTLSNIASLALENSYLFENLKIAKEEAEESNRLKTAFLHNISHEIRTPLNAIVGFTHLLGQPGIKTDKRNEYINIVNQSNKQLLSIIDDILNLSYIEAGQMLVNKTRTDLRRIFINLYNQYHPEAEKKGLEFNLNFSIDPPNESIITDETKLIQVLTNLLNNAVKFTHGGSIELGCRQRDDHLEMYVADTGIGIHETEHARIFERFYKVDKSVSRLYGGTGLGLAISAAYVQLMRGRISIDSAPGKGSRFTLTLPLEKANAPNSKSEKYTAKDAASLISDKTILVAEDDNTNYMLIHEILSPLGFKTIRASTGPEAIGICSSDAQVDLVLMDIKLPLKDGYDTSREIHDIRPDIPIIAQSAFGYKEDIEKALKNGCSAFLVKPFGRDQLIATIKNYLK
jgi:hypothetical protein